MLSARQIVGIYSRRMQIEQSFRDLKCDRFGCAFYYSLTRKPERIAMLLFSGGSPLAEAPSWPSSNTAASFPLSPILTIRCFASDGRR